MKKTYAITLKGTTGGVLNYVALQLDGKYIQLDSPDSVTWSNNGVDVDFDPPLHIHLEVGALKGTKWDIAITAQNAATACYSTSGKTGDQPIDDDVNTSLRDTNTTCQ